MTDMTVEQLAGHVKRQDPEKWKTLRASLKMAPDDLNTLKVEQFCGDPAEYPLTNAQYDFLLDWLRGYFAISNVTGEVTRVAHKPAQSVMLGVRGNALKDPRLREFMARQYEPGEGNIMGAMEAAPNRGRDLLEPDAMKTKAIQKAEQDAITKRKAKKGGVIQGLMTFGQSK